MHKKYGLKFFALFQVFLLVALMVGVNPIPSAQAAAVRIMPLGDSITGSPGCWRALLWNRLQNTGFTDIDFVGTLGPQGCGVSHDGDNEGHGGILATNMANQNQLVPWLAATNPDIVVMHLGTNDVWSNIAPATILTAFGKLVDQMRANNPNVKILVAQIIPVNPPSCPECAQRTINFNAAIPAWASSKSTAQSPITVVDQWSGFNTATDTGDGVHPNDLGIQKISDRWYPALSALLSTSGTTTTPTRTATRTNTPSGPTFTPSRTPTRTNTPSGPTRTPTRTNTPIFDPTPRNGPDLRVTSVVTSPDGWTGGCANNLTMGIRVTVLNSGEFTTAAGPFIVDVSGTQQTVSGGLAAGASINLWFQRTGSLLITVDSTNLVNEINENNNTSSYVSITATPPVLCTRTPTPTVLGPTFTATRTPTRTLTPTNTPGTPVVGGCSPVTSTITTIPFVFDGAGTFCWQAANLGALINSWNTANVSVNGVNYTNIWVSTGSLPAKINGFWYVSYTGNFPWSHFEAK
jgi:lysophospholipase L1-like esterase